MNVKFKPATTNKNTSNSKYIQVQSVIQDSAADNGDSKSLNQSPVAVSNQAEGVKPVRETPAPQNKSSTTPTAELENWSASFQTLLDQPPSSLPYKVVIGGIAFCLAFGTWATFGTIEEVGHAQGRLVPLGQTYKIHPVDLGKVTRIAVKEGQKVQAGQVLIQLDTELDRLQVERLQQTLAADKRQLGQMQAILDRTRLEAKTLAAITEASSLAQKQAIAQAQSKAVTASEIVSQLQANKADYEERLARLKRLEQQGAIARESLFEAKQAVGDRTRAIIQTHGELQQATAQVDQLGAELLQKQAQADQVQLEAKEKIQQLEIETTQLQAKIADTENLLATTKAELFQKFLRTPVDGIVSSLNIDNTGEVVQPSQTVVEIAPANAPLVLSARLPNREAGFVKPGMPVQVKFDAYPYQDYGVISSFVKSISPDSKPDERLGAVYQVEIELERNYITAKHQNIKFKPGQTATADIIIRRRRIADILLDPFRKLQNGGINL